MYKPQFLTISNLQSLELLDVFLDVYHQCVAKARQGITYINHHTNYIRYHIFCNDEYIFDDPDLFDDADRMQMGHDDETLAQNFLEVGAQACSGGYFSLEDWYRFLIQTPLQQLLAPIPHDELEMLVEHMYFPYEILTSELGRLGDYYAVIKETKVMSLSDFLADLEHSIYSAWIVAHTTKKTQNEIEQLAQHQMNRWRTQIELIVKINRRETDYLDETELHALGYRVGKSGDSRETRHKLLDNLLTTNILSKKLITATLSHNINRNKNNPIMTQAVADWETDLQHIKNTYLR